ncbi:type 2 isopentenyl-diphosphate Delta-isomerase [Nocardia arizonensis]|uniref:type 2 isopentenyl-diphosphate Delta-isomerase n=1 Tax=Nocardia arizonensis TaxID=1141647 RepID=UPI0006D22FD6|nr:type 2 isopentenyl-diphosphate Delta-isomerase [Nocardia arizonensis]
MTAEVPVVSARSRRKDEHLDAAMATRPPEDEPTTFDDVSFVHGALPSIGVDDVRLGQVMFARPLAHPLYVNAMTGGTERSRKVNADLAAVARDADLPIASGSMATIFRDADAAGSFEILRKVNPRGIVFANINANCTADQALYAVDLLAADALQVHVNAAQELGMDEGDRSFGEWRPNIESICRRLEIPVIVKEVGFGISWNSARVLIDLGVSAIDVSGRGGTNFARIERYRRGGMAGRGFLDDWGQSTPEALIEIRDLCETAGVVLLGSGGVRSSLDVVRCLRLGARAVGVSGAFLSLLLHEGADRLSEVIAEWKYEITALFALLNCSTVDDLRETEICVTGGLRERLLARGIPIPQQGTHRITTEVGRKIDGLETR